MEKFFMFPGKLDVAVVAFLAVILYAHDSGVIALIVCSVAFIRVVLYIFLSTYSTTISWRRFYLEFLIGTLSFIFLLIYYSTVTHFQTIACSYVFSAILFEMIFIPTKLLMIKRKE